MSLKRDGGGLREKLKNNSLCQMKELHLQTLWATPPWVNKSQVYSQGILSILVIMISNLDQPLFILQLEQLTIICNKIQVTINKIYSITCHTLQTTVCLEKTPKFKKWVMLILTCRDIWIFVPRNLQWQVTSRSIIMKIVKDSSRQRPQVKQKIKLNRAMKLH